jgi:hypothetical protein
MISDSLSAPRHCFGAAVAEAVDHPTLRVLLRYWQSKSRDGRLPRLADLDPPTEIPRITTNMSIILTEGDPPRFKYKRMGSAIVADRKQRRVRDATGHYLDEVDFHTPLDAVLRPLRDVVRLRQPYHEFRRYRAGEYANLWYEWLVLPMSEDGAAVTSMMTGYVTLPKPPARR